MPEVMNGDFVPSSGGRNPAVDITEFKEIVDKNRGHWVVESYSKNNAASVRRQFLRLGKYVVRTSKHEDPTMRTVAVKWE